MLALINFVKNNFGVNSTCSPNDFSWKFAHLALSNNHSLNVNYCYISAET